MKKNSLSFLIILVETCIIVNLYPLSYAVWGEEALFSPTKRK
jgi:hypothetical protein